MVPRSAFPRPIRCDNAALLMKEPQVLVKVNYRKKDSQTPGEMYPVIKKASRETSFNNQHLNVHCGCHVQ